MITDRCQECGSPVRLSHELNLECSRNVAHAFGGPGSGWHAEKGHVPGSQGGKTAKSGSASSTGGTREHHAAAKKAHAAAAVAHADAADYGGSHSIRARKLTAEAVAASKIAGAKNDFGVQAAKTYSDMADTAVSRADRKRYHYEAVKYHQGAARSHEVMAKNMPKSESSTKATSSASGKTVFKGDPKGSGTYKAGRMTLEVYKGMGGWYVNKKGGHPGFASRFQTPGKAHEHAKKAIKDFEE